MDVVGAGSRPAPAFGSARNRWWGGRGVRTSNVPTWQGFAFGSTECDHASGAGLGSRPSVFVGLDRAQRLVSVMTSSPTATAQTGDRGVLQPPRGRGRESRGCRRRWSWPSQCVSMQSISRSTPGSHNSPVGPAGRCRIRSRAAPVPPGRRTVLRRSGPPVRRRSPGVLVHDDRAAGLGD